MLINNFCDITARGYLSGEKLAGNLIFVKRYTYLYIIYIYETTILRPHLRDYYYRRRNIQQYDFSRFLLSRHLHLIYLHSASPQRNLIARREIYRERYSQAIQPFQNHTPRVRLSRRIFALIVARWCRQFEARSANSIMK